MIKNFIYILFFLTSSCVSTPEQSSVVSLITADELVEIMQEQEVLILDVRTPEETALGMIDNAVHVDFYGASFIEETGQLEKGTPVVVYCASGIRSARASLSLMQNGFRRVYDLKGGIRAWQLAGYKISDPE